MSRGAADRGCLVYVGNLPEDIRDREIEDLFSKYGKVLSIDMKAPVRPPAFAFVEFGDPRDAEDAVKGRDGYDFYGNRLRVELAKGASGRGGGGMGGGMGGGGARGFGGAPPPGFRPRNTGFRILVKGLPMSASWQDVKDFIRQVCKPAYTNCFRDRDGVVGVVEFETQDDMDRTIRKLDDTEFRNPFDSAYVRLVEDRDGGGRGGGGGGGFGGGGGGYGGGGGGYGGGGGGGYGGGGGGGRRARSRSRSRSRGRRSRSRSRSRGRRSRSGSPKRSNSKSRSRSPRSRSPRSRSRSPVRSKSPAPRSKSPVPRSKSPARSRSPAKAADE